jgi:hypothetical protein
MLTVDRNVKRRGGTRRAIRVSVKSTGLWRRCFRKVVGRSECGRIKCKHGCEVIEVV